MKSIPSKAVRTGLMATTTLCGAMLLAPGLLVTIATTLLPAEAQAQDYTSGAVIGTVTGKDGPVTGATITLTSKAQGQTRTLTSSAAGTFSATGLTPGEYDITVSAAGFDNYVNTFSVVIAQEIRITAALQTTGAAQTTVVVKGKRIRQDFTKTTSGLTVDLDTLVAQQPIARSVTAVAMLAPTVTQGNPGFGDVASFGGGSVAENAYYIDGLNITNPDTYVGSAKVPFDFYKTIDIQTSGYAAEFGRATGGVVNATTKSGTNTFKLALHGNYQPMDLREEQADTYAYRGKFSDVTNNSASIEVSGPIIKDRLFFYGLYQANDYEATSAGINTGVYTDTKNTDPFFGGKLDAYITPTQHLSLTYFDTSNTNKSTLYTYDDDTQTVGDYNGYSETEYGGKNWVLNYNGKVTDWFSISAAIGDSQDRTNVKPADTASYYVLDYRSGTATPISEQASSGYSTQESERKFWRADGDVRFDAYGHHHVRFGIDHEKNSELKTTKLVGDEPVQYRYRNYKVAGVTNTYLQIVYENLGGNVSSEIRRFISRIRGMSPRP